MQTSVKIIIVTLLLSVATKRDVMGHSEDRFVPSFPELVFNNWLKKVNATQTGLDIPRRNTLIGKSYIRTYTTDDGERKIELYKTKDGEIYDVGEHLDMGETADTYISTTTQIIASRIIWSLLTQDKAYIRSVFASNNILVESDYLGSKEKQVFDYLNNAPDFGVDNFFFTVQDEANFLVVEVNNKVLKVKIVPTLDLLLQGQSLLLKDHLTSLIRNEISHEPLSDYVSPYYQLQLNQTQYSFSLPDLEYYRNKRRFVRNKENTRWITGARETERITENDLSALIAHRWSTLSLPDHLRFKDILTSDRFTVEMIIEGYPADTLYLTGSNKMDLIGDLVGKGLPAYYNTISIKKTDDHLIVKGIWLVRDPELFYEHIFRVQDIFAFNQDQEYVWIKSEIRALMGVRSDHIANYRALNTSKKNSNALFRINLN